ncbi:nucleotidyltransferase domain-containing protein [Lederbergia sp. NSJ-179]|uniref:nucleotidyltransferase family protein n=1 Tax=Lederbergia sp. NSJ-179 TaxID=2931402 RepID=UPI001FD3F975|nr:nucleotidyltransferase domain-containing protein [Lederbergia sp. NSJ-179]MCJ7840959.1 nucleotidyltransferase domain-containing protein [Lederbergia sp. NSJ-179]
MFGLIDQDFYYITKALNTFEEIEKAIVFGSRALGNYKKGSDVDLAIYGQKVTNKTVFQLNELLNEEYPLPYFFDIVNYSEINNPKLKEHIDKEGKMFPF